MSGSTRKISTTEISKHSTAEDSWIVLNGEVWDVTYFAPRHPGGYGIIANYLGGDASQAYNEVHGPDLVRKWLEPGRKMGVLDESTVTEEWRKSQVEEVEEEKVEDEGPPPLETILNTYDFENAARKKLSKKTWAFYSGAANDCLTLEANISWYRRIFFRPRVLVGVKNVSTATTIMGEKFKVPIFSSPAALAKLSHPEGELAMARGLARKGASIVACNNASFSYKEIKEVMPGGYPSWYQLYVNKDREVTEKLVKEVEKLGPKAIVVTVDLPVVGKREADERLKIESSYQAAKNMQAQDVSGTTKDKKGSGLARATGAFIDPDLKWEDITWLKSITSIPLFVKGIQCAADARKALEYGCEGIYISNHGGRAVDTAQPSILTLMEINANCPEVLEQMEVFIDGGIRRGTDVLKAICLGATGVCLGRPFLYAVCYGQEGVEHCIDRKSISIETSTSG
jgi:L-lactate dehydrogenase (cytochrome)